MQPGTTEEADLCSRESPHPIPLHELCSASCKMSLLCPIQVNHPMPVALEFSLAIKLSNDLGPRITT